MPRNFQPALTAAFRFEEFRERRARKYGQADPMRMLSVLLVAALTAALVQSCASDSGNYKRASSAAGAECRARFAQGAIASWTERAACINDKETQVAIEFGYPHMDLLRLAHERRLDLARRLDGHEISEEMAEREWRAFYKVTIWREERKRGDAHVWNSSLQQQISGGLATGAGLIPFLVFIP